MNNSYFLWQVNEKDFPKQGSLLQQLRFILQYAIMAPNSHNTQPWKFKITPNSIKIYPNFLRTLPYSDRSNRQLYISLGCALGNLLVALEHFGFSAEVIYLPESDIEEIAIEVKVFETKGDHYPNLFSAIQQRVTNRFPYTDKPIPDDLLHSLLTYNTEKDIHIELITGKKEKEIISEIAKEASRFVYSDKIFKEELGQWIRSVYTKAPDGMPLFDLPIPSLLTTFAPSIMRKMPARIESRRDFSLFKSSPAFILFHSNTSNKEIWMKVGKIFELISLELTKQGISHAPWAGVIEHDKSNKKIKKLLHLDDNLLFFVRLGYAKNIPHHSPRRAIDDVIL
jgi:nitroreductase